MPPRRILVVDDSPTIRRVVAQGLRHAQYDVATADDGEMGLLEVRGFMPDLILLDFVMPSMNGYQFVQQLDKDGQGHIPIVLMVTRTDQVPAGAMRSLGVVDTITKPFSPEVMLSLVAHTLERSGKRPEESTSITQLLADEDREFPEGSGGREFPVVVGKIDGHSVPPLPPFDEHATSPGRAPFDISGLEPPTANGATVASVPSTESDRFRADEALQAVARILAEGLAVRGVHDADSVATSLCADLRAGISSRRIGEVLRLPTASLTGDLSAVALPEVLQLMKFQGQTGVLEVALEPSNALKRPARFEVATKDGMVVSLKGTSLRADLLLGNYFVGAGLITRAVLEGFLHERAQVPIGQRLLRAGLVTAEQLRRCIGAQAQDLMTELLRKNRGFFMLRRGEHLLPEVLIQPGYSVDMLLFEGLRRIDEWSVIEKQIPNFEARFVRLSNDVTDLTPDEMDVLSTFTKANPKTPLTLSVAEVLAISSQRAFECCKILYRLASLKKIARVD